MVPLQYTQTGFSFFLYIHIDFEDTRDVYHPSDNLQPLGDQRLVL